MPTTIVRATHSTPRRPARLRPQARVDDFSLGDMRSQPVDIDWVAERLADHATGPAPGGFVRAPELAGRTAYDAREISALVAAHDGRSAPRVVRIPPVGEVLRGFSQGRNLPGPGAETGGRSFEDWLAAQPARSPAGCTHPPEPHLSEACLIHRVAHDLTPGSGRGAPSAARASTRPVGQRSCRRSGSIRRREVATSRATGVAHPGLSTVVSHRSDRAVPCRQQQRAPVRLKDSGRRDTNPPHREALALRARAPIPQTHAAVLATAREQGTVRGEVDAKHKPLVLPLKRLLDPSFRP